MEVPWEHVEARRVSRSPRSCHPFLCMACVPGAAALAVLVPVLRPCHGASLVWTGVIAPLVSTWSADDGTLRTGRHAKVCPPGSEVGLKGHVALVPFIRVGGFVLSVPRCSRSDPGRTGAVVAPEEKDRDRGTFPSTSRYRVCPSSSKVGLKSHVALVPFIRDGGFVLSLGRGLMPGARPPHFFDVSRAHCDDLLYLRPLRRKCSTYRSGGIGRRARFRGV